MGRPATGSVVEPKSFQQSWALRIPAYGERYFVTLGTGEEGWSWKKADEERQNVMADVRRGTWVPPETDTQAAEPDGLEDPLYHDWAEQWFEDGKAAWDPKTIRDNKWALECHLLPFFADLRLSEITIEKVDEYRVFKLREARRLRERAAKDASPPRRSPAPSPTTASTRRSLGSGLP